MDFEPQKHLLPSRYRQTSPLKNIWLESGQYLSKAPRPKTYTCLLPSVGCSPPEAMPPSA